MIDLAPSPSLLRDRSALLREFKAVRRFTEKLCEPLETEDYGLQSMPDASPVKWHLAHTSWFFETFILAPHLPKYTPFDPRFGFLFNSYYNAIGSPWPRPQRGLLSRPTVVDVYKYRAAIDERINHLFDSADAAMLAPVADTLILGLNHEQQHQELILTDLKHALALNPLRPGYRPPLPDNHGPWPPAEWLSFPEGIYWVGHEGTGFAFDNEGPRHRVFLNSFRLASRLATNEEYLQFMADDGYARPELWLSDAWAARRTHEWSAPLYWEKRDGEWHAMTLGGMQPLSPAEPVCHLSYYEADAFARWAGARLPTEAEWETACPDAPRGRLPGHFVESERFHPAAVAAPDDHQKPYQMFGDVWQWTSSPYSAYPGYRPVEGALGEYNGKFMCNQFVLRGASCATPRTHSQRTYRNFFPPEARWQFTGVRLAQDG
jgi:ergothioneine biosynthesis protein EgtB